jgi:copper chaperone CopZ
VEEVALTIPSLWADHHVLAVRDVLCPLEGVETVAASALNRRVTVAHDPARVTPGQIVASLAQAGYAVGDDAAGATDVAAEPPTWAGNGSRVTVTNPVDLAMSGDYRKY